jgi:hypothetical protein
MKYYYLAIYSTERIGGIWSEQLIMAETYGDARRQALETANGDRVIFKMITRLRKDDGTARALANGFDRYETKVTA